MAIILKKICFTYLKKSPFEKEVFKNLNLEIPKEKITAIIGPNCSGKTTLMKLICGLLTPDKGEILIDKKEITKSNGISFSSFENEFIHKTVYKEILFGMTNNIKIINKKKKIIDSLLLVGLNEGYLYKNPLNLSSSEKRKIILASLLISNPKIILLDEPTITMDDKSKEMLMKLLIKLKEKYNKTIVIISHDVDFIHKFADHIIILKDGKIIKEGLKEKVFENVVDLKILGIEIPKIIEFIDTLKTNKNIDLKYHDDIKELMKAVYRNVK